MMANDYEASVRGIVECYNLRRGVNRIFDDMVADSDGTDLPKSFMQENMIFLQLSVYNV
jgi:hypothetical protein